MATAGEFTAKVHMDGPDKQVVENGGSIDVKTGGKVLANGTQAAAIADTAAITGGEAPTEAEFNALQTKFNSVLVALRGAGIIAP